MSSQNKQEKKIMDEKIAKVREVVKNNFSTNDIVLALHYFELDVEKTIHAFLQGGYKEALGNWEQTGSSGAKKNNKKKSKANKNNNLRQFDQNLNTKSTTPSDYCHNDSNGFSNGYFSTSTSFVPVSQQSFNTVSTVNKIDNATELANAGFSSLKVKQSTQKNSKLLRQTGSPSINSNNTESFYTIDNVSQINAIITEFNGIENYASELNELKNIFDNELSLSQTKIQQCIQEFKKLLVEREQKLCTELSRCRDTATKIFSDRCFKLKELSTRVNLAKTLNDKDREDLYYDLKNFNAAKAYDQQIAYVSRFNFDNTKIFNAISSFGEVIPIQLPNSNLFVPLEQKVIHQLELNQKQTPNKINDNNLKVNGKENVLLKNGKNNNNNNNNNYFLPNHLNEISDHNQTNIAASLNQQNISKSEKNVAQLAFNGIVMQSDALSTEQLVEYQKRIEETLRSQGLDPSILNDIGVNNVAPRRRSLANKAKNGGRGGKNFNNNRNDIKPSQQKIDLSILK